MNKVGHINVTKRLSVGLEGASRFCLLLGSILPDIFVHTYITGHKWDSTFEKNCERLMKMEQSSGMSFYSYLKLGYVIHYIEDYFTFPHNTIYKDDMKAHVKYEIDFYDYLKNVEDESVESDGKHMSVEQLCYWIKELHDEYMAEAEHGFETDYKYITKAAQKTAECMLAAFARNEDTSISIENWQESAVGRD